VEHGVAPRRVDRGVRQLVVVREPLSDEVAGVAVHHERGASADPEAVELHRPRRPAARLQS
jgi:hypothetical protein